VKGLADKVMADVEDLGDDLKARLAPAVADFGLLMAARATGAQNDRDVLDALANIELISGSAAQQVKNSIRTYLEAFIREGFTVIISRL